MFFRPKPSTTTYHLKAGNIPSKYTVYSKALTLQNNTKLIYDIYFMCWQIYWFLQFSQNRRLHFLEN